MQQLDWSPENRTPLVKDVLVIKGVVALNTEAVAVDSFGDNFEEISSAFHPTANFCRFLLRLSRQHKIEICARI